MTFDGNGRHRRHQAELPGAGTVAGPIEQPSGGPVVWFAYTDHTQVLTIYSFDARTRQVELRDSARISRRSRRSLATGDVRVR